MSPKNIVMKTKDMGLDVIAITDHNMVENAIYAYEIGKTVNIHVLIGMELQTIEEIHLLAIFDSAETGLEFQKIIYDLLPCIMNRPDYFGDQVVVDVNDNIVRTEDKLLVNSAGITIDDAVKWIASHGGIAIPSHIDSPSFSILSQIGSIPQGIPFHALEIRDEKNKEMVLPRVGNRSIPFVAFSDAHYIEDIGKKKTLLLLDEPNCFEIKRAFKVLAERGSLL